MPARIGKALASKPMMHGHDQSDSPVRAKKSANNAERSAAESMEQRGGPKGKTVEPATRRAQNRESVSPGLDRLRQFVRNNRKARVTTPLHHVESRYCAGRIFRSSEMRLPGWTAAHGRRTAKISRNASLIFTPACIVEPIARFLLGDG